MAKDKAKKKASKHVTAKLPAHLAEHVGEVTGNGGIYDSRSEYIRDLVRRDMEQNSEPMRKEINDLLESTFHDDEITEWSPAEMDELRKLAYKKKKK